MASLPGCCARLLKVVGTSGRPQTRDSVNFQKSHLEKPAMSANTVYMRIYTPIPYTCHNSGFGNNYIHMRI